jgi:hypothetical protein
VTIRGGLAWLSSSSAEIARARDVLKSLRPAGVIDELGFLVLFGAFADRLYPATNTIMTRARYLVFVPAIYQYLEASRKASGKDADRVARDFQYDLSRVLLQNESTAIGKEAGRGIVRPPSNIYWSALPDLRIATQRIAEASYQERLSGDRVGRHVLRDDDDAAHPEEGESLWDPSFRLAHVLPGGVFPARTSFRLWKTEAVQLRERYAQLRPEGRDTMLSHLVELGEMHGPEYLDPIEHAWDVPHVPAALAPIVDHARRLSLFARGVTLHYHGLLIEKRNGDLGDVSSAFRAWWRFARDELREWDLTAFFTLIRGWGAERRSLRDREFIEGWIERCMSASSAQQVLDDPEAQKSVCQREASARPEKRRLRGGHHLDSWKAPSSYQTDDYYLLSYRHPTGRQFARDIADGLLRGTT